MTVPAAGCLSRGENGGACALTLVLLGDLDTVRKPLGDAVTRPDDRDHPLRTGRARRIDDPLHKGLPGTR